MATDNIERRDVVISVRVNKQDTPETQAERDKRYSAIIRDLDLLPESIVQEFADEIYTARCKLVIAAVAKTQGPLKVMRSLREGKASAEVADSAAALDIIAGRIQ